MAVTFGERARAAGESEPIYRGLIHRRRGLVNLDGNNNCNISALVLRFYNTLVFAKAARLFRLPSSFAIKSCIFAN
jgi:hypothetical protein